MSPDPRPAPMVAIERRELERLTERLDFWRCAAIVAMVGLVVAVAALLT